VKETKTRFEKETKGNSQMAYIIDRQFLFSYLGQSLEKHTNQCLFLPEGTDVFSVFISHVIKTKNRNRSINKFKNLGYDR